MITLDCDLCGKALGDLRVTFATDWYVGRCIVHGTRRVHHRQPVLAGHGLARSSDPETSKAAAESVDPEGQQGQLMRALIRLGTGTCYELAREAGLNEHQAGRRLSELNRSGLIFWNGETRPGETGRQQSVYEPTDAGERWLLALEGNL